MCGNDETNVGLAFEVGDGRHGCVRPLLGNGIFTQDGHEWEASRKLLAPMIQRPTLPDLTLIERHFQQLHNSIGLSNQVLNMKEHLLDFTLKLVTEFLLGESANATETAASKGSTWTDDFATEFNIAFKWISKRERFKIFYWMVDGLEFRKSCSAAKGLVDQLVCRAKARYEPQKSSNTASETYVALESLLRQEQQSGPIRDHFMNLLLAGRDSTGSFLCWVFYALAREPQLAAELMEEVENMLGPGNTLKPDKRELSSMIKLDRFICESKFQKDQSCSTAMASS